MEQIWTTIQPYVMDFINILLSTGLGGLIVGLIGRKIINRSNATDIISSVSQAVTSGIVTKNIKVDLQTVNKQQIERIKEEILSTFVGVVKAVENQSILMSDMAQVMTKFKAVTTTEKEQIAAHVKQLTSTELVIKKELDPVVVTIEPVKTSTATNELSLF